MSKKRKLIMSISLNALEHLGINLYSNIPAVLSEIVANAEASMLICQSPFKQKFRDTI